MKTRRHFIKSAGALALGSMILPELTFAMARIKNPGIQLYTVRTEMLADAKGTLKQLANLGIKQIESARSAKGNYYGLTGKEMKQECKDLGMTLRSGHVAVDAKWQQTMEDAAEAGQEYLICSSMPKSGQTIDNYKQTAEVFNRSGEECRKMGLKFGYHNHDYEFEKVGGQVLYDVLMDNTDPKLVHMELDLGWVVASGNDPLEYFKKYKGRFPLWHLKDMDLQKKHSTEFGKGGLDIVKVLQNQNESGLKYFFIEQEEYAKTPLESMKYNMDYLERTRI
ncbi:sugar phosphate isomerase/epimerase family protein [Daejeonella lutea]|uniref:Sugar phosphate isomerase/epimerase n=1 Tax=Daejeonella lutea TaxID=572036 RepID=A0A1T5EQZ8_9SPHI|nr:sugar phosphate isomerase/epimerase [Daejeonella lutea]SKB86110.1 Sugar phosphate isomerase/epimerase [Daejeonella lutea]